MGRRYIAALLFAASVIAGCEEKAEHVDPDAIRRFDDQDARNSAGSTAATASAAATAGASAAPTSPRKIEAAPRSAGLLGKRLVDEAAAIVEKLPPELAHAGLFASASWHLEKVDRGQSAEMLFEKALLCLSEVGHSERRVGGISLVLPLCRGGRREAAYAAMLVEVDRELDKVSDEPKTLRMNEMLLLGLIRGGRYDQAMLRLAALKTPAMRIEIADTVARPLAGRDRKFDVLRCAEIIRQASESDAALQSPGSRRALVSVLALADDPTAAERVFHALPAATDVAETKRETTLEIKAFSPTPSAKVGAKTYSAAEFRPIVDLAAARRRGGDTAGCIRLIEAEFERLKSSDLPACITAWVECDEFERAAQLVRLEADPRLKPRYAALLCLATAERGRTDEARRLAAEFERFPYPRADSDPANPVGWFDSRFSRIHLSTIIPLLLGDEPAFRERIKPQNDLERCTTLLRAASLEWAWDHPHLHAYVPFQEEPIASLVFEEPYWRYSVNGDAEKSEVRP
jgi:hypothetical protein